MLEGRTGKVSKSDDQFLAASSDVYKPASSTLTSTYADGSILGNTVKTLAEHQHALDILKISDFKDRIS
ncbi:hypothetical protein NDK25_07495 [Niallia taxi]|nr:hypothetical protein [Niallia taxi]MDE5052254.1 hypothetical protein [Niallia taxi]